MPSLSERLRQPAKLPDAPEAIWRDYNQTSLQEKIERDLRLLDAERSPH